MDNTSTSITAITWIFRLPLPKTQRLIFEEIFKKVDQTTLDNFRKISVAREEVRSALETEIFKSVSSSIEKYMPGFFGLMASAEALPADFTKALRVIWTSPIGLRHNTNPYVSPSFRWEVVSAMLAYGISLRNQANDLLKVAKVGSEGEFDEKSKEIANLLCKAAGVFEHVSTSDLSHWSPKPDVVLPEIHDETYHVLSNLCLAEAQEISVVKGLIKGVSAGALSKLTVDIFQKYEHCLSLLRKLQGVGVGMDQVLPSFSTYLSLKSVMWKAFTYKMLAQDHFNHGKFGPAVAFMTAARDLMVERKEPNMDNFMTIYNNERHEIHSLAAKYAHDNDTIYFERVPTESDTLTLPESKCIMKVVPFNPPSPVHISINQAKGYDCCIQ